MLCYVFVIRFLIIPRLNTLLIYFGRPVSQEEFKHKKGHHELYIKNPLCSNKITNTFRNNCSQFQDTSHKTQNLSAFFTPARIVHVPQRNYIRIVDGIKHFKSVRNIIRNVGKNLAHVGVL